MSRALIELRWDVSFNSPSCVAAELKTILIDSFRRTVEAACMVFLFD
jgi:hypothetical protein